MLPGAQGRANSPRAGCGDFLSPSSQGRDKMTWLWLPLNQREGSQCPRTSLRAPRTDPRQGLKGTHHQCQSSLALSRTLLSTGVSGGERPVGRRVVRELVFPGAVPVQMCREQLPLCAPSPGKLFCWSFFQHSELRCCKCQKSCTLSPE